MLNVEKFDAVLQQVLPAGQLCYFIPGSNYWRDGTLAITLFRYGANRFLSVVQVKSSQPLIKDSRYLSIELE